MTVSDGSASLTVTVTDPEGLSASKTWGVTVGNVAPEPWSEARDFVMEVDEETTRYFPAFIIDCNIGDSLAFTLSNTNPTVVEARVEGSLAHFKGLAEGTTTITMTGEDRAGLTADVSFVVTVANNRAPALVDTLPDEIEVTKGDRLEFVLTDYFVDPDGDNLTYSVVAQRGLNDSIKGDTLWVTATRRGYKYMLVTAQDPDGRQAWQETYFVVEDPEEDSQLALSIDTGEQPGQGPRVLAIAGSVQHYRARTGSVAWMAAGRAPPRRSRALGSNSS